MTTEFRFVQVNANPNTVSCKKTHAHFLSTAHLTVLYATTSRCLYIIAVQQSQLCPILGNSNPLPLFQTETRNLRKF